MGATTTPARPTRPARSGRTGRPGRSAGARLLLGASLLAAVASLLPWIMTPFATFWGLDGPGRFTLYAAMIGLAGALARRPRLVLPHALVLAAAAIALPVWQLARVATLCPPGGCLPSIGLLLTLLAGATALRAAWLARDAGAATATSIGGPA
jgi:hypothetical protein